MATRQASIAGLSHRPYLSAGLEGIGWGTYHESFWEESLIQFRYPYIGLKGLDARTYLQGDNWLGVPLSALMRIAPEDRAVLKADAMQRLATLPLDPARQFLLCEWVEAYLPLEGPSLAEYDRLLRTEKYQEAHMVGQTNYEKGIDEGQLAILLPQIQDRFGPVSEIVR